MTSSMMLAGWWHHQLRWLDDDVINYVDWLLTLSMMLVGWMMTSSMKRAASPYPDHGLNHLGFLLVPAPEVAGPPEGALLLSSLGQGILFFSLSLQLKVLSNENRGGSKLVSIDIHLDKLSGQQVSFPIPKMVVSTRYQFRPTSVFIRQYIFNTSVFGIYIGI